MWSTLLRQNKKLFFKMCFFERLTYRKGKMRGDRDLPSLGTLPKWLQLPGTSIQAEARSFFWVS